VQVKAPFDFVCSGAALPQILCKNEKALIAIGKMNPVVPPCEECLGPASPPKEYGCQFTLKSMMIVVTAMLIGGETGHRQALSGIYLISGRQVDLSVRGEVIYFVVGCIGTAACAVATMACWQHIRRQYAMREVGAVWREVLLISFTTLAGIVGGVVSFVLFKLLLACSPSSTLMLFVNAPQ